jgi:hypothetical protein
MNVLVEAYLIKLQEFEEVQIIDYCRSIECPKKRLICLKLARSLLSPNLVAQHKVDREIDVLTNNYEGSGEIGNSFVGEAEKLPWSKGEKDVNEDFGEEPTEEEKRENLFWGGEKSNAPPIKQSMDVVKKELDATDLSEAGFKHYPKGWTGKSVKKFSSSLVKGGAKPKGFFEKCVEKMRGKVDNPEGFCASAKDEVYKSTGWRGKNKTPAEVAKAIKKKQFKLKK